jgi:hypothetical protein
MNARLRAAATPAIGAQLQSHWCQGTAAIETCTGCAAGYGWLCLICLLALLQWGTLESEANQLMHLLLQPLHMLRMQSML